MAKPHTILLVDDHPAFRLGLRQIIASDSRFTVIGEASDGETALDLIRRMAPDVTVLDLSMPKFDGLELMRQVAREHIHTAVVVLTMHQEESFFQAAMDRGAAGYVLKENAVEDILHCLQTVAAGGCYLSPSLSGLLLRQRQSQQALRNRTPGINDLTPMERKILKLIADNKTSKQIGAELYISPRTVDTHRRNICVKLGLSGSHRLLQFAIENRASL